MSSVLYGDVINHLAIRERELAPSSFAVSRRVLLSFDQHLEARKKQERSITEDDVLTWLQPKYAALARGTIAPQVCCLRKFSEYLRQQGISAYIPPNTKVPDSYVPYLFSETEIRRIFKEVDSMSFPPGGNLRLELPMLLRMLYSCGFRLSELLAVRIGDINFERGFIFLKNTKNRKQRLVPLGNTLTEMLNRYCLAMNLMSSPENYIFPGRSYGTHISRCQVEHVFKELLENLGIYTRPNEHTKGPCLHCFRHLFAIKSFAQAEQAGRTVNDSIPFLSIYMGHCDLTETEKYLKFSSDMFPENTELFETYTDGVFPEVQYED